VSPARTGTVRQRDALSLLLAHAICLLHWLTLVR
jgi:hypothetical protein